MLPIRWADATGCAHPVASAQKTNRFRICHRPQAIIVALDHEAAFSAVS